MGSFSYMVSDQQFQVQAFKAYDLPDTPHIESEALERIIRNDRELTRAYAEVRIAYFHPAFTLVPNRLYRNADKNTYLEELTPLAAHQTVRTDKLHKLEAHNVYAVDRAVEQFADRYFTGRPFRHLASVLIDRVPEFSRPQLLVHSRDNRLLLLLFIDGHLQIANSFSFQSAKDFLYYILLLYQQFQLDRAGTHVQLSGEIQTDSEIYRLLDRYLDNLSPAPAPDKFQFGKRLKSHDPYFYYDLLLNFF